MKYPLRVRSGGQTGADSAALFAAHALDIPTGGWAAKGWLTEDGPAPWLADYGLREFELAGYANRTIANVRDSTGTVIFGSIAETGSRLTFNTCSLYRPCLHLDVVRVELTMLRAADAFVAWLERERIEELNVAGNRESVNPGITQAVVDFLFKTLK